MTDPVTTKVLKLDLDPGQPSSNKKDKKGKKKATPQASTSIIDSILKMKNSSPPESGSNAKPVSAVSSPAPAKKKKLIIDMSNDSHIIAEEKPNSPEPTVPAIKPLFAPVKEKPLPTITLKADEKKRGKTPELNPESSKKLNTMLMLDNLFPSKNPVHAKTPSPVEIRELSPPPYPDISIIKPVADFAKHVSTPPISQEDPASKYNATGLEEITEQITKVRAKLTKKPDDPKYTDMLAKLEAKLAKYKKKLAKKPDSLPLKSTSNPPVTQPSQGIITEIDSELVKTQALLDKLNVQQPQPAKFVTGREPGVSAVFAVPNELASIKERKLHLLAEQKKLADKLAHRQKQIDRIKNWQREVEKLTELQKEKQKIFDLQRDLKKLEKQQYLQDQQLKQQLYNIKKQTHEKSLELKRQDAREYKAIREAGLNLLKTRAPAPGPAKLANQSGSITRPVSFTLNSKPSFISRLTSSSFFSKLGKIKIGERVFFNKPAGKQSPGLPSAEKESSVELVPETVVDKKTGLEFFTAEPVDKVIPVQIESSNVDPVVVEINKPVTTPLTTGSNIDNPGPAPSNIDPVVNTVIDDSSQVVINPATELTDEEIIEKAKQLALTNSNDNIPPPTQHEIQVSKEIMSSKLGILSGDTGLDKILTLATNGITTKTEKQNRNACLLNMYKDITDAGILVC